MAIKSNIEYIKQQCTLLDVTNPLQVAYVLATVKHETNNTFEPVVEAYWVRDKFIKQSGKNEGLLRFDNFCRSNFRYYPYYGRGLVQITWKRNYKKLSKALSEYYKEDIDLVKKPELALNLKYSIFILVYGMKLGLFTGKNLDFYIKDHRSNFYSARRIINGTDKASLISEYAMSYLRIT